MPIVVARSASTLFRVPLRTANVAPSTTMSMKSSVYTRREPGYGTLPHSASDQDETVCTVKMLIGMSIGGEAHGERGSRDKQTSEGIPTPRLTWWRRSLRFGDRRHRRGGKRS